MVREGIILFDSFFKILSEGICAQNLSEEAKLFELVGLHVRLVCSFIRASLTNCQEIEYGTKQLMNIES